MPKEQRRRTLLGLPRARRETPRVQPDWALPGTAVGAVVLGACPAQAWRSGSVAMLAIPPGLPRRSSRRRLSGCRVRSSAPSGISHPYHIYRKPCPECGRHATIPLQMATTQGSPRPTRKVGPAGSRPGIQSSVFSPLSAQNGPSAKWRSRSACRSRRPIASSPSSSNTGFWDVTARPSASDSASPLWSLAPESATSIHESSSSTPRRARRDNRRDGHAVHPGDPSGEASFCVDRIESSQPLRLSVQPGRTIPLHPAL